ncbi:DUF4917 family protein [Desulfovibrio desulfuricans]|uniref:DUF4917 family protein n=1 Tax=Desulfovibrio desulfuricans TaxID=876 RepID=UPI0003B4232A|nr:DUF4917 family protein [Desulfovibrio desulfuricans]
MDILSFEDSLAIAGEKRHLMLGNGFSVAIRPDIFRYGSLFEKADFSHFPEVRQTFDAIGSEDFEEAVEALERAALVLAAFTEDAPPISKRMRECAAKIKDVLVQTIAGQHPEGPGDITDQQYEACINFLRNFRAAPSDGRIFTLNYDILLYWALMHGKTKKMISFDDGFRTDRNNADAGYVVWDDSAHKQNVYYLHGALHLFDGGHELQKYTWNRTDIALVAQTREAIAKNLFPLFVAEGSSQKKLDKIYHHGYLSKGLRSLSSIQNSLFLYGVSLSPNDEHLINIVVKNINIRKLFVSLFGSPKSSGNQQTIAAALAASARRDARHPLEVHFYDSETAKVWG